MFDAIAIVVVSLITAVLLVYLTVWGIMIAAFVRVVNNADALTINNEDPLSTPKGILAKLSPQDTIMVSLAGRYLYLAYNPTAANYALKGLKDEADEGNPAQEKTGLNPMRESDWDRVWLEDGENPPHPIHSSWGYLSPFYVFRLMVYRSTGRHVVRGFFPLITSGPWELFAPEVDHYERARKKGLGFRGRPHMELLEQDREAADPKKDSASVWNVYDTTIIIRTDHDHEWLTPSFPNSSGLELRGHFVLQLAVTNFHRAARWKRWSSRINATTSEAFGSISRPGDLDTVYASKPSKPSKPGEDAVSAMQRLVKQYLTEATTKSFDIEVVGKGKDPIQLSLMQTIGRVLRDVALVDLVPADEDTARKIHEIMEILPKGTKQAEVANLLLTGQVDVIKGLTPEQAAAIQGILFAQKLGNTGKVDFLINTGGAGGLTVDQGMLNRIAKGGTGTK